MESSRRDLFNDMAEHGPILKNNQNTYHPVSGKAILVLGMKLKQG